MTYNPLCEVFGFPVNDFSARAERYRRLRLCPFNNRVANCTKDKANDPLGVCSILDSNGKPVITCPVRFRQDWRIAEDAAAFFFPPLTRWTTLSEIRLNDGDGFSAGNVDLVIVAYDDRGSVVDFGALEVQAVYISGNVRRPFEHYMADPPANAAMDWRSQINSPRPDYLSSSRKRLAPQLLYKGGILHSWGKKQAVALNRSFFATLPSLPEVAVEDAEIAWFVYDLISQDGAQNQLSLSQVVYTQFEPALEHIITSRAGNLADFISRLQNRLDQKLDDNDHQPDVSTLADLL